MDKHSLQVDFVDVGQGDCILVRWQKEDGTIGHGLVDCVDTHKAQTAIDKYLEGIKVLDFMLLSHPHHDHFSGLSKVLEKCDNAGIKVSHIWLTFLFSNNFLGKFQLTRKELVRGMINSVKFQKRLLLFLDDIAKRHERKLSRLKVVSEGFQFDLNSELALKVLGPNIYDATPAFITSTFTPPVGNTEASGYCDNPNANMLASCVLVGSKKNGVLLTSDIETSEKKRVFEDYQSELQKVKVIQVPHHGSTNGHCEISLKRMKNRADCEAVVSVGPNKYGHPKKDVVEFYAREFKDIHGTACENGFKNFVNESKVHFNQMIRILDINSNLLQPPESTAHLFGTKKCVVSDTNPCFVQTD